MRCQTLSRNGCVAWRDTWLVVKVKISGGSHAKNCKPCEDLTVRQAWFCNSCPFRSNAWISIVPRRARVRLCSKLLRHAFQNWWCRDRVCGGKVLGIRGVGYRWRAESLELYQVLAEEEVEGPIQRDAQLFLEAGKLAEINRSPHPPG